MKYRHCTLRRNMFYMKNIDFFFQKYYIEVVTYQDGKTYICS